jgi:hypothetical protein
VIDSRRPRCPMTTVDPRHDRGRSGGAEGHWAPVRRATGAERGGGAGRRGPGWG